MRILVVTHAFLPESIAGTELMAQATVNELGKRGATVGLIAPYYRLPNKRDIPVNIPLKNIFLFQKEKAAALFGEISPRARSFFKQVLKEFRPDTVYFFHTLFLSFDLPLMAKKYGARVVYGLHDFSLICPRGTLLARNVTRSEVIDRRGRCLECLRLDQHPKITDRPTFKLAARLFLGPRATRILLKRRDLITHQIIRQVDVFISPSRTVAQAMINFGASPNKIHVISNGLPKLKPSAHRSVKASQFNFTFVGTIALHKGVPTLLEAWSKLQSKPGWQLHFWGPIKDQGLLDEWLARWPSQNVIWHGPFDPSLTQSIYNQSDAVVVPSLWFENQPLVILQSCQTRTPIIASNLGGMRELIQAQKTGLLFPVGNALELASQMHALATNRKLYQKIQDGQAKVKIPTIKEHLDQVWPLLQ